MDKLKKMLDGQVRENVLLKEITTVGLGGPARYFLAVKTKEELIKAIQACQQESIPYLVIGGASNLLVSDQGFPGLIIKNEITGLASKGLSSRGYSGTPLQELVDFSISQGLAGLHKLTGIPGTIGGAIYGNAGAFGQTISDHLIEVVCLNPTTGILITLSKAECNFGYRDSIFKRNSLIVPTRGESSRLIILETVFKLDQDDPKVLARESAEILKQRLARYPAGLKCPGSFFKNIEASTLNSDILKLIPPDKIIYGKIPAGYLLESVGAKGQSLGQIQVSLGHGNLFINKGKGSASDFYQLSQSLAQKVQEKYNITLEPEVQLINLPTV